MLECKTGDSYQTAQETQEERKTSLEKMVATELLPLKNCKDVGCYKACDCYKFSDQQRIWLLKNAFSSSKKSKQEYGKSRSFKFFGLRQYSWLSYSESLNGLFYKSCFLFAKNRSLLGQLIIQPLSNFIQAKTTLKHHELQSTHK